MKKSIQVVNKNGIEGYFNSCGDSIIVRGVFDSTNDITIRFNSLQEIVGGFDSLDLSGLYCMFKKGEYTFGS